MTDGQGGEADQSFSLPVQLTAINHPPSITSQPATDPIPVGDNYVYQVVASDPDGDPLTYSLDSGVSGMAIDPQSGLFTWTPSAGEFGTFPVTLSVSDGRGGVAQQSFDLEVVNPTVTPTNHPPTIGSQPTGPAVVGQVWQYQVVRRIRTEIPSATVSPRRPTA